MLLLDGAPGELKNTYKNRLFEAVKPNQWMILNLKFQFKQRIRDVILRQPPR
jgi:hypothetical protein